jgi:Kef-type K+ transport system membrane component KefB
MAAESGPENVVLTLSIAVSGGVFFQVLAERLRIPAIAPLLVGGVLLGPEFAGSFSSACG